MSTLEQGASSVEDMYKNFGVLADAKDKAGEHEDAFKVIICGVKGGANEKRLASQFITRFFKYFPDLQPLAIEALFDLCEDDDVNIRKQAIKDLPSICKVAKKDLAKVADVLVQLLQTDDLSELSMVQSAMLALFRIDAKGALGGLFSQILSGDELIRERACKFMSLKLKALPQDTWTSELEQYFLSEAKRVLQDCTGDEFVMFMKLLSGMEYMQTVLGRKQLIEIVEEQSEMDSDFQASDPDAVDRLIQCFRQALPYFSKNVHSDKFVCYMCDHVLPVMSTIAVEEQTEGPDIQLDIVKLFAELTMFCGDKVEGLEERVEKVYKALIQYMPLPPTDVDTEEKEQDFKFTYVECLMFSLHMLSRKCPEFFTDEKHADRLADFKKRLQFFARGVQVYIKQLRAALQGKAGDDLKTEENKIRVLALKTTSNIHTLIKDLFHNPPSFKAQVTLSWKPISVSKSTKGDTASSLSPGQKRPGYTPIKFDENGDGDGASQKKQPKKSSRSMYSPPTGKFSNKAGEFPTGKMYSDDPDQEESAGFRDYSYSGNNNRGYRGGNRGRGGYRGGGGYRGRGGNRGGGGYRKW